MTIEDGDVTLRLAALTRQLDQRDSEIDKLKQELEQERNKAAEMLNMARKSSHDLNQRLSVLQAEIDLAMLGGEPPDETLLTKLQMVTEQMTEHIRSYQKEIRIRTRE